MERVIKALEREGYDGKKKMQRKEPK